VRIVEELGEFGNAFGVGVSLELEALALEECLQLLVVGDDTVVDDCKLPLWVRPVPCQLHSYFLVAQNSLLVRVAVLSAWLAVGGPSGVCNTGMRIKDLGHVDARFVDEFSEFGDLAHLFECEDLISLVPVNC